MVPINVTLPSTSKRFPRELIHMLPLRSSICQYKANMGRVSTTFDTPELEGDGQGEGRIFTMAACPPIVGMLSS
jgi:hypothetical protein